MVTTEEGSAPSVHNSKIHALPLCPRYHAPVTYGLSTLLSGDTAANLKDEAGSLLRTVGTAKAHTVSF